MLNDVAKGLPQVLGTLILFCQNAFSNPCSDSESLDWVWWMRKQQHTGISSQESKTLTRKFPDMNNQIHRVASYLVSSWRNMKACSSPTINISSLSFIFLFPYLLWLFITDLFCFIPLFIPLFFHCMHLSTFYYILSS